MCSFPLQFVSLLPISLSVLLTLFLTEVNLCFCLLSSCFPYVISGPATPLLYAHIGRLICVLGTKKSVVTDFGLYESCLWESIKHSFLVMCPQLSLQ